MTWMSPWAFALAGLMLPLVAAFLNRRKVNKQRVPSLILLRHLAQQEPSSSSFALPRHWIALLLCLLALAALVIALAKPVSGDSAPRRYIIILDTSASMSARAPGDADAPRRFDQALSQLEAFSEQLYEDDELVLITAGTQTRVSSGLMRDPAQLLALARQQTPSGQGHGLAQAMRLSDALCQAPERSAVLILSDDAQAIQEAQSLPSRCATHVITLGAPAPNLGITALSVREADQLGLTEVYVEVFNHSDKPRQVPVDLSLDGRIIEAFSLDIPPNKAVGRLVRTPLAPGDVVKASLVSPSPDALPDDNAAYASRLQPTPAKVLLVGEHPRSFVAEALRLHPRVHLTRVAAQDPMPPGPFSLIVLESEPTSALPPSPRVVALGLPPAQFGLTLKRNVVTPSIIRWDFAHGLFRYVEMDSTRMDAARAVEVPAGGRSLVDVDEGSVLVETPWDGRTLLYLGFKPDRSDMVLRVAFVNFIANLVEWTEPIPELAKQSLLSVGQRVADAQPGMTLQPLHREGSPLPALERVYEPGVYRLLAASGEPAGQVAVNLLSLQETELGVGAPDAPKDPKDLTQGPPPADANPSRFISGPPPTARSSSFPWQALIAAALAMVFGEWVAQPLVQQWDHLKERRLAARVQAQRVTS
jgi:hypothetical protein